MHSVHCCAGGFTLLRHRPRKWGTSILSSSFVYFWWVCCWRSYLNISPDRSDHNWSTNRSYQVPSILILSYYRLLGRSAAARSPNPLDSVTTAERGSSLLRRITRSAVRVSTEGAIKEWLCQPRFKALPSPGRVLGRAHEIKPRTSAVMFGNKQLAS